MKRLIIKVCGMREAENIRQVEQIAPDWMGFICWNGSARFVEDVPEYMPRSCCRVGVFVNPSPEEVRDNVFRLGLDAVQLHGQESPDFCMKIRKACGEGEHPLQLIKAFGIEPTKPFPDTAAYEKACDYFLFDTHCATAGGSGKCFDWKRLQQYRGNRPFLLSGGIGEEHADVLRRLEHPMWAGIDLNSRFEKSPALKDVGKLKGFINLIREQ